MTRVYPVQEMFSHVKLLSVGKNFIVKPISKAQHTFALASLKYNDISLLLHKKKHHNPRTTTRPS